MKNNNFKNIKHFLKNLKKDDDLNLAQNEKQNLRSTLFRELGISEAVQSTPQEAQNTSAPNLIPSPLSRWHIMCMSNKLKVAVVAALVLLFASSGVAYAAEKSLPGDLLYPIKINVNEKVERVIKARTPEARAALEVRLIDKRLNEADKIINKYPENDRRKEQTRKSILKQINRTEKTANSKSESQINAIDRKMNRDNEHENRSGNNQDDKKNEKRDKENTEVDKILEKHDKTLKKLYK